MARHDAQRVAWANIDQDNVRRRVLQHVAGTGSAACKEAIGALVGTSTGSTLLEASGHGVFEFGNRELCETADTAQYWLMSGRCGGHVVELGLCAPHACHPDDLSEALAEVVAFVFQFFDIDDDACSIDASSIDDVPAWPAVYLTYALLVGLALVVVVATLTDQALDRHEMTRAEWERTLCRATLCRAIRPFSIRMSYKSLFTVNRYEVLGLHGIRMGALLFIIFGHTAEFMSQFSSNTVFIDTVLRQSYIGWLSSAGLLSVGTFFMLSGFFGTLSLWSFYDRATHGGTRRVPLLPMYLQVVVVRLLRLWPTLIGIFLVYLQFLPRTNNNFCQMGYYDYVNARCSDGKWWSSVFFMNNWYPAPFGDGFKSVCMGWSWYLSVDLQMHLMLPVIVHFMHRFHHEGKFKTALSVPLVLVAVCLVAMAIIVSVRNIAFKPSMAYDQQFYNWIYNKPWGNLPVFLWGCIAYFVLKVERCRIRLRDRTWYMMYVLALGMMVVMAGASFMDSGPWGQWETGLYVTLGTLGWCMGVSVFVAACCVAHQLHLDEVDGTVGVPLRDVTAPPTRGGTGHEVNETSQLLGVSSSRPAMRYPPFSRFIDGLLGWAPFVFISRLSYGMYLLHPMVIFFFLTAINEPLRMSREWIILFFVAVVLMTMILAFMEYVMLQRPLTVFITRLVKKDPKKKRPDRPAGPPATTTDGV